MTEAYTPASVFSLAEIMADEMEARGWTAHDVAIRMSDRNSYGINVLALSLFLACSADEQNLLIDHDDLIDWANAFDVSPEFFQNIHNAWMRWPDRREPFSCPEHLLAGKL